MSKQADAAAKPSKILVIDDEEEAVRVLTQILEHAGYEVTSTLSGKEGISLQRRNPADLIIMASHNPKFWDVLLGSIASQVVKHAQHSVLVVRQKRDAHAADIHDESRDALDD